MRDIIDPVAPPRDGEPTPPLGARIGWFFALTFAGVGATAALAYGLRLLLRL